MVHQVSGAADPSIRHEGESMGLGRVWWAITKRMLRLWLASLRKRLG